MKYPAASQAQRNRRMRNQETMQRSYRRSGLIRRTSESENQALPPAPIHPSVESAISPFLNGQNACSPVSERRIPPTANSQDDHPSRQ